MKVSHRRGWRPGAFYCCFLQRCQTISRGVFACSVVRLSSKVKHAASQQAANPEERWSSEQQLKWQLTVWTSNWNFQSKEPRRSKQTSHGVGSGWVPHFTFFRVIHLDRRTSQRSKADVQHESHTRLQLATTRSISCNIRAWCLSEEAKKRRTCCVLNCDTDF